MEHLHRLTSRELDVIRAILAGHVTREQIAAHLSISPRTATSHMSNIRGKTNVRSKAQLILMCLDRIERAPALQGYKF